MYIRLILVFISISYERAAFTNMSARTNELAKLQRQLDEEAAADDAAFAAEMAQMDAEDKAANEKWAEEDAKYQDQWAREDAAYLQ